ncbi:hypothetical protein C0Q70_01828 [Pomacea canaliculata]|uniref:Calcium-activated chloride channel N-terminal domain-containing protein n=1 Tax=Pomacea canaliculata TaxID=400727 RepID=A0A2T7Q0M6_POMCA|nr:hypothetical protein C0Q70_01828 [Pomacea canaliculata]
MAKKCLWLLFVVLFLVTGIEGVSRESAITLQNNEYTNILVSISPEVSASSTLVATIKTTFTKASAILYQATNHRAVFRDVTILVPSTWPTDPSYTAATTQVFSNSDIVFVPPPAPAPPQSNPGAGQLAGSSATPRRVDVASTKAFAGCGLPGIRITMATDLLTNRALTPTFGAPVQFCDDDQSNSSTAHNYEAPSHHNLRCGHRSTWAVISESSDFNNGNNPPRPGLSTTPVFTVVQAPKTRRLVVAIDTSSIMAVNEKLREVHQAATTVQRENTSPDVDVVVTSFGGGDEDPLAAATPTTTPTSADFSL